MHLSYSLTREEYVEGVKAIMSSICATDEHVSWTTKQERILIAYYILLALSAITILAIFPEVAIPFLFFAAAVVLLDVLMRWGVQWATTLSHGVTFNSRRHENMEAGFDGDTVAYIGREHQQQWRWTLVQRFHDLPNVFVLEFAGYEFLVIPKRAFPSEHAMEEWMRMAARFQVAKAG